MGKAICKNCGTVLDLPDVKTEEGEDWLKCLIPTSFEWSLPAGKLTPVIGEPLYVSALGEKLTRSEYVKKYRIDPEIAYERMRGKQ